MNRIAFCFLVVLILALPSGCTKHQTPGQTPSKGNVIIQGYYDEPESLENDSTIVLGEEKFNEYNEYIEIVITGKIIDLKLLQLEWDIDGNDLIEVRVKKHYEELENQTLVLKTVMPEGIPSEKIKFKSLSGKEYSMLISDKSLDGKTENRWEFTLE